MENLVTYEKVDLYRREKLVLKDVSLNLLTGEFYYLVGRVGSGKSTLLKSMYADVKISSGERATVLDYDLKKIKEKEIPFLRRKIGIVFQDFQLLQDWSVHSNLEFVCRATGWHEKSMIEQRINEVLYQVGMVNKSYKMPYELSGGEQQRIVIARALLNKPALILADEPTGNLDPQTGFQILTLLHNLSENGVSVLMATHNHQLLDDFPGKVFQCIDKKISEYNT